MVHNSKAKDKNNSVERPPVAPDPSSLKVTDKLIPIEEYNALVAQRDHLLLFKVYVHNRLDLMDIPKFPEEKCRIGKRLDHIEAERVSHKISFERNVGKSYRKFMIERILTNERAKWTPDDLEKYTGTSVQEIADFCQCPVDRRKPLLLQLQEYEILNKDSRR